MIRINDRIEPTKSEVKTAAILEGAFVILQEMMHGKDIVPLESDRVIKTLTDLITE